MHFLSRLSLWMSFLKNKYNPYAWIIGKPEIGEGVWIGAFTVIDGSGGLKIRKGTTIASGSHIYTHNAIKRNISEREYPTVDRKPVEIGEYVHVGPNATILMGCTIGHHSVIGAGAVVLEDTNIPPYSIVAGVPAKVIKKVSKEY